MNDQASLQLALSRDDPSLNVGAFVQVLTATTNSYKYLFLLALLNRALGHAVTKEPIRIPLTDLAIDMLTLAWYPCRYFKLSFGAQDQIPQLLLTIGNNVSTRKHGKEVLKHIRLEIQQNIDIEKTSKTILRYVPFRLLRPFFSEEVKGGSDSAVERLVPELSRRAENSSSPALYALHGPGSDPSALTLHLHPKWHSLILSWHQVIHSWALHEWAKYLQARNPAMPNVLGKLLPLDQRNPVQFNKVKRFWREVMSQQNITCPYTHERLRKDGYALDHFLPWSYVGHDLPWNLIPVTPAANSSKGAKLPDEKYIDALAARQHLALNYARKYLTEKNWGLLTESYCQDLRLDAKNLLDRDLLSNGYNQAIAPQISIAKQLGFEGGWNLTDKR
jgi:hypothetical protein